MTTLSPLSIVCYNMRYYLHFYNEFSLFVFGFLLVGDTVEIEESNLLHTFLDMIFNILNLEQ